MNLQNITKVVISTAVTTSLFAGVAFAATPGSVAGVFDSLTVGKQGTGGVTFFNGTIINATTENGADNPVTFGDNVRIDGRIFRGNTQGTGDSQPFIIDDNAEVNGSLSVSGTDIATALNQKANNAEVLKQNDLTTRKIAISPQSFRPLTHLIEYAYSGNALTQTGVTSNPSDTFYYNLPIEDGASITKIQVFGRNNTGNVNSVSPNMRLEQYNISTGTVTNSSTELVIESNAGGITENNLEFFNPFSVDTDTNAYRLIFTFKNTPTALFYGSIIEYQIANKNG